MLVSIIIPVFNEAKTVQEILTRVSNAQLPKDFKKEIIVVDDGSTDKTSSQIKKSRIKNLRLFCHAHNQGKGAAVRTGISKSKGDVVVIQDADLEYNPNDISYLLQPIIAKKTLVVYGSRLMDYPLVLWGAGKTPLPSHWLGNKLLSWLTGILYRTKITDMETCYKLISKRVLNKLNLKSNRFEIEPEITAKILKLGHKIFEIPIKVKPRTHAEGKKIKWHDGVVAVWTLIRYKFTN